MKKTFRFLSMAALLVVGAIMTGCSNEDNIDNPQQPANIDNVVTLTATVSLDGGAGTRAITPGGTDTDPWTKTFESGNQIAVIYKNTSNQTVKAVSTDLTPTGDNTTATFTVTLTNPTSDGAIRYIYPATMAKTPATTATITDDAATIDYSGLLSSQDGTLATLGTNYDLAVFDGSLSGTDLPASASLTNPLAICKFTLTDGSSAITSNVTSLNVSDGTNTYHVTPSGLSEIYVAMKPVASHNIAFTAATGSKTYFKTTASAQTLTASTLYTKITVSMVELAKGNVIGYDGNIYVTKADAEAVATGNAAAVIVYVGNDAETSTTYNHGLALALLDVYYLKTWCSQKDATCLDTGHQFDSEAGAKGDMAGMSNTDHLILSAGTHTHDAAKAAREYNDGTHPAGTSDWFLPSAGQWDKMATAAGSYANLKNNADLQNDYYWSSSECDANDAWYYDFYSGYWARFAKDYDFLVRACLAF